MSIVNHKQWANIEDAEAIVSKIQTAMPDANLQEISDALNKVLKSKPSYSTLTEPVLHTVKSVACGEFALGYYYDQDKIDHGSKQKGTMMVVLNKRPKKLGEQNGPQLYACTGGGYMELGGIDPKTGEAALQEQPHEGAARELREETLDDKGKPILDVDPDRMNILISGIDYEAAFGLNVHYSGYSLEMTPEEYKAMSVHAARLANDDAYKDAVFEKTNGEVIGYEVMPLSEALKLEP